jgi:16S rRNA (cytidine1402-2'-O)-methyltransferase
MSGILYVVATPIGNLEDVTLRALRVLREVSLIAAEDTRRTSRLLQHYSISTPTTSLHEHNEYARTPYLIDRLQEGASIAVVSDAGTPGISDPGGRLVSAAHAAGVTVVPVPGPSAVAALVSVAGGSREGFVFAGFPPARSNSRKRWLQAFVGEPRDLILYEAPHRIAGLLEDLKEVLGDRMVAIGRELTKLHETLAVRPISDWLRTLPVEQGEFVLLIQPAQAMAQQEANDLELAASFRDFSADSSISRREAIRATAERFSVSTRRVFAAIEATKNSVE